MKMPLALLALMLLASCRTTPTPVAPPQIVKVTVREYVPVPAELDKDCTQYTAREQTYAEAKRLAILRAESIDECNQRAAQRRALRAAKP